MGADHKAGLLKQTNKLHKTGGHKSKRAINKESKGKVSVKAILTRHHSLSRDERRLRLNHIRENKREELIQRKRDMGQNTAPFLTIIIPLNSSIDPLSALSVLANCDPESNHTPIKRCITHISIPRFKQKFSFVCPRMEPTNEFSILDCLKVCDSVLFVASAAFGENEIVDKMGQKILNMALAQGVPLSIVAIMDLESVVPKKRTQIKSDFQKLINKDLPEEKVTNLESNADGLNVLRKIANHKRKIIHYKENRPHMYCEDTKFVLNSDEITGSLQCTGYLRGVPLSANRLCHVPGFGDFQISKIEAPQDPYKIFSQIEFDMETKLIEVADPLIQTTLVRENIFDPMDAEQTWPTDDEIIQSKNENRKMKLIKRIPKGMSDYQACWIPDIEEVEGDSEDSDDNHNEQDFMSCESGDESNNESIHSDEECESNLFPEDPINNENYDKEMDFDEEKKAMEQNKLERTDAMFPDEIDTPIDTPAKQRFKKYRGLESFRTSTWDCKENLPDDYARIFQFENYNRTKRRIIKEAKIASGVLPGSFVTIEIKGVDRSSWENYKLAGNNENMIVYGMLQHEQQMSVLNVVVKRTGNSTIPIKSKERLLVQCGYRRFTVNPIFSQHSNGDKHKYERFFRPHTTLVATFYAPIQFTPAPVLCFRENPDKSFSLVASGNVLSADSNRIILKRIVLSGSPYKINRKTATIRHMFFNKEDIEYFKPCKLRTKCGRVGHIRESLGTHGHMKCVFDGPLKSYDTIFLYLYKRMFSKWTFEDYTRTQLSINESMMQD